VNAERDPQTTAVQATTGADPHRGERRFAPGRTFRLKAWGSTAGCLLITGGLIWLPLANPDGSFREPVQAAVIGGVLFGTFTLLGVYLTLFAARAHVLTSPTAVHVRGALRRRTVLLANVTRACWRRRPAGGSIVLHTSVERAVIEFAVYQNWRDLVAILRASVPAAAAQEGWDAFESFVLTVRKPPVITESMTLRLAVASLAVALAYWAAWDLRWVRMTAGLPLMFIPTIAVAAALDAVRRRTPLALLATTIAFAAVACLAKAMWPVLRLLVV
jgi:hypothetical protein